MLFFLLYCLIFSAPIVLHIVERALWKTGVKGGGRRWWGSVLWHFIKRYPPSILTPPLLILKKKPYQNIARLVGMRSRTHTKGKAGSTTFWKKRSANLLLVSGKMASWRRGTNQRTSRDLRKKYMMFPEYLSSSNLLHCWSCWVTGSLPCI